jgi:hypothetical protein
MLAAENSTRKLNMHPKTLKPLWKMITNMLTADRDFNTMPSSLATYGAVCKHARLSF